MSNPEEEKSESILYEPDTAPLSIKTPEFSSTVNYYKEYWRLYLENERLLSVLQESQNECLNYQRKINAIQVIYENILGIL